MFLYFDWLIVDCMVSNTAFNSISVISWRPVLLTSTVHNILSKSLAVFPHNHCRNNGQQWERNESCGNDNPWKEYWLSQGLNQQPSVLKSATLPTERWGLAPAFWQHLSHNFYDPVSKDRGHIVLPLSICLSIRLSVYLHKLNMKT